ncbi:hypothetical protein [Herbaspirillum sp. SJZ099]|uniref:hypothetical protein n=1 Tax=Herbaspirillum sp. SJZ099 TaxID=2572916 RepID=UPI00119FAAC7|nr:hypothetical protein [Herbaspirillum sp. SJZ099]
MKIPVRCQIRRRDAEQESGRLENAAEAECPAVAAATRHAAAAKAMHPEVEAMAIFTGDDMRLRAYLGIM